MGAFWLENRILLLRWWFRLRREPLTLLSTLAQPVLWLLLFGHLLARMAAGEVPGGDYLRFMTAGAMGMDYEPRDIDGMIGVIPLRYDAQGKQISTTVFPN